MQLQNVIVFMGAPGSGKGTQTKLLAVSLGYHYFSTGEISREYAKHDTDFGKKVKSIIDAGIILPIDIIQEIFIKKFESILGFPGVILDGYPRTTEQAQLLEELMHKFGIKKLKVIFLDVERQKLLDRLSLRGKGHGRADDEDIAVGKRFDEYIAKTAPVKDHYESQGKLIYINGDQTIEKVHQDILSKL